MTIVHNRGVVARVYSGQRHTGGPETQGLLWLHRHFEILLLNKYINSKRKEIKSKLWIQNSTEKEPLAPDLDCCLATLGGVKQNP